MPELIWRDLTTLRTVVLRALRFRTRGSRLSASQCIQLESDDVHEELFERLPGLFDHVRVFHACRPLDLGSYYVHGLVPLNVQRGRRDAKDIFLPLDPSTLSESDIDIAADEVGPETRDGYLYASLDNRVFAAGAGHYLIYGSEYIGGIATELYRQTGRDYQRLLRERGTPTVFVCALPISDISETDRRQLAAAVAREIASDPSFQYTEAGEVDFSFFLRSAIKPEQIRSHYHPAVIPDPLNSMSPYRWYKTGKPLPTHNDESCSCTP